MTLSLEDSLPDLLFDRDRMNQVIYNLLGNAVRYVPQGRALFISAVARWMGKTPISLRKSGIRGTAFRPISCCTFSSISTAVKPRGTARAAASGIGLALARQLVQSHGGKLWAESKVGEGTSFFFTLPVTTDNAHPTIQN